MEMNDLAKRLMTLRERKECLKASAENNDAEIAGVQKELAELMIDEGNDSFSLNGYKFSLKLSDHYSSKKENREELLDTLKLFGYDRADVISETVSQRRLNSIMKAISEENGDSMPGEFDGIVTLYSEAGISVTKENGKGGKSRAGKTF